MGHEEDIFATLVKQADYGEERWWLALFHCSSCKEYWLVACEQRVYDVYFLKRLHSEVAGEIIAENMWPRVFQSYADLLKLGIERGHHVCYAAPLESLELYWTTVDLAIAKPGIYLSELCELLPIDMSTAKLIAQKATSEPNVDIDFTR